MTDVSTSNPESTTIDASALEGAPIGLRSVQAPAALLGVAEPRISVVIPVYQGGDRFRRCLESIVQSHRPADELIVVCDGHPDDSWKVAAQYRARVIRLPHNGGAAAARNRGAELASGDIIFFVDADVTLHPDTLGQVAARFAQDPALDALIGSYDSSPAEQNFLSQLSEAM